MRQMTTQDSDFEQQLSTLLAFETVNDGDLLQTVDDIIAQVRAHGDSEVLSLTQKFDQHPAATMAAVSYTHLTLPTKRIV